MATLTLFGHPPLLLSNKATEPFVSVEKISGFWGRLIFLSHKKEGSKLTRMDARVLNECERLSFENKAAFPEIIRRLAETGVERYCADLVRLEKFYYSADGQNLTEAIPLKDAPKIGSVFQATQVQEAIRAIQQGKIDYPEFLKRIMKAGVVYYDVFVDGRRTIYTGRSGDFHVENFPGGDK